MSNLLNPAELNSAEIVEPAEPKHHLISQENFALLKSYQQKIFEATQVTPSLRKILNQIISTENLEIFSRRLIESLNH